MSQKDIDLNQKIVNVAIIAHVDHGKTTLVDALLHQTLTDDAKRGLGNMIMDNNQLEKERGITIYAKCTSVMWLDDILGTQYKINIIDTPGHADFGAEVERIMLMASTVILLVDSSEGVMPQTRFVLGKAISAGLNPIVVINKMDKPEAEHERVLDEIEELFLSMDVNDTQLNFPVLYAAGRDGWCIANINDERKDIQPLLRAIVERSEDISYNFDLPFKMVVTLLGPDKFLGRILTGKVYQGIVKVGDQVKVLNIDNQITEKVRITKLFVFYGVERSSVDFARAGDIIAIAGIQTASVSDTIASIDSDDIRLPANPVDPPTMSIKLSVNDSPFAGRSGDKLTANMIKDRLLAEMENNVAIQIEESKVDASFEVKGRGELQLSILIENMRREGFELSVGRPTVVYKKDGNKVLEPIEEVIIDVENVYSGIVMEKLNSRKGMMQGMQEFADGRVRISYLVPARALIGYHSEFLTDTKGTGIMNHLFYEYGDFCGKLATRNNGVLISNSNGKATSYSIESLQDRGILFVSPQAEVYEGMIVGEHNRDNDLDVNITKAKQLTNVRAAGKDEVVKVVPPREITLENGLSYIAEDEMMEVTPNAIRLRKRGLKPNDRKKYKNS